MAGQVLERAVLKAADLFRVEGLLEHCVEAFGRGLKVNTAVEQLVWAHNHGPAEARAVATEYFVRNGRRIQVDAMCESFCVWFSLSSGLLPCRKDNNQEYHMSRVKEKGYVCLGVCFLWGLSTLT